jgi:small subunit ribosomal protein S20
LKNAEPVIARMAQQGIVHRNTASRKISRLAHAVKILGA